MGNDTIIGTYGYASIDLLAGNDSYLGGGGGFETVLGNDGADTLISGYFSYGSSLYGGNDADSLQGSGTLDGGAGADTLVTGGRGYLYGGEGNDSLQAQSPSSGSPILDGGAGADTLVAGTSYDATLLGGEGGDSLVGTSGHWQQFYGGAGNDTLFILYDYSSGSRLNGEAGDDLYIVNGIVGGSFSGPSISESSGNDTLSFQGSTGVDIFGLFSPAVSGIEAINLAGGGNRLNLTASRVRDLSDTDVLRVIGGANDTLVFGDFGWSRSAVADGFVTLTNGGATVIASENLAPPVLLPTNGNDSLSGTNADDAVDLLAGNDTYIGLAGNDSVLGGLGNDSINGGNGADSLSAGEGNDIIFGGNGSDSIDGGNGYDVIDYRDFSASLGISVDLAAGRANDGMGGIDTVLGIEAVFGGTQNDTMIGGEGGDNLFGSSGNDSLLGGAGNDVLQPSFGLDTVIAGEGNDLIFISVGSQNDSIDGGNGTDALSFSGSSSNYSISIDLVAGRANDGLGSVYTLIGIENISSGSGNDTIIGNDGAESFLGGNGQDSLIGGSGNDTLNGGDGADTLVGGAGNDWLYSTDGTDAIFGGEGDDVILVGNVTLADIFALFAS
jgi:Ca2+-binding RTX toxin-like protein